jgi:hypothetical protein
MRAEKYVFNPHTLSYEKVRVPLRKRLLQTFGFISSVVVTAAIFITITNAWFPSQKEKALMREIDQMKMKYDAVNNQFDLMAKVLDNLQERDAAVHRMIFGMDPIDKGIWDGGVGGHQRYDFLAAYPNTSSVLKKTLERADKLERQIVLQSMSLDTIQRLAENMKEMHASLPAIKPVREDKLNKGVRAMSGYGMRIHPVLKVKKMHTGIDFTAPEGTPIQVTGDGRVVEVNRQSGGYGLHVVVDHGFGYKTLYAHMKTATVKVGEKLTRGQQIGTIGNTGTSTAPHLHYEVIYKGQKVNPIHYVIDGLSIEEYNELIEAASVTNMSFDY